MAVKRPYFTNNLREALQALTNKSLANTVNSYVLFCACAKNSPPPDPFKIIIPKILVNE